MSGDPEHDIVEVKRADGTVAWRGPRAEMERALAASAPRTLDDLMAARKERLAAKVARAEAIHAYVVQHSTRSFDHEVWRRGMNNPKRGKK